MNPLLKALLALVPVSLLLTGSVILFLRESKACLFAQVCLFVQLLGASCLMVVVLAHIAEALRLFPFMGWGREHSIGHYIDLSSVALGATLFPLGYFLHSLARGTSRVRVTDRRVW